MSKGEASTHTTRCIEALRRRAKDDPYYGVVADEMERVYKIMIARHADVRMVRGLLKIAKLAMPDTFFATDRYVKAAKAYLKEYREFMKIARPKRT